MNYLELLYIRPTLRPAFRGMHVTVERTLSNHVGNQRGR
jgi:hypothetical protein